jgi:hypothetical protein
MIPEGDGGEIYFWQYLKDSFSWQRSRGTQILRPKNQFTPTIWYSRGFCSILCFKDVWCLFLFVVLAWIPIYGYLYIPFVAYHKFKYMIW